MPSITLKRAQVAELVRFCAEHKEDKFFVAKDHGAYVGANTGKDETFKSIIYYFPKCDPEKDQDWYENASDLFGGDDFGEMLPVDWLAKCIVDKRSAMRINVNKRSITATYLA